MKTVLGRIASGHAIGMALALGCCTFTCLRCALADPPSKKPPANPAQQAPSTKGTAKADLLGVRLEASSPPHTLTVTHVRRASPADRYGIRPGNQITSIDGKRIVSIDDFNHRLDEHPADQDLRIAVTPGTEKRELKIIFSPAADGYENAKMRPVARLGVTLKRSGKQVTVAQLYSGGPADKADVRSGDRIEAIDGQPISSRKELYDALKKRKPGDAVVVRLAPLGGEPGRDARVTLANRDDLKGRELVTRLPASKPAPAEQVIPDDWLDADEYQEISDPYERALDTDFDG